MAFKSIAIGSDHAGFDLKAKLVEALKTSGYQVLDVGTNDATNSVDYPDFGKAVAEAVTSGKVDGGVVVCGTGIGISIAANRHPGIRAALCHDVTMARLCREHNDANVLALGARLIGETVAKDCLDTFLTTDFAGERHVRRVEKLG
ncbi:MAG: ribose 5-phosphate isomerase B [Kiloniellaceae bacterium]